MEQTWTEDIEQVLSRIQANCSILTEHHRLRYISLFECIKYFKIPIIILSAVNSVFGVMMQKFTSQTAVTVFTSCISLIVGIIGSVELFLGVNDKLTKEMSSQKDTYNLAINISKMLILSRANRTQDGHQYLEESFNEYQKIVQQSNVKEGLIKDTLLTIEPVNSTVVDIPTRPYAPGGCL